jgi:hypothetical protein
MTHPPLLTFNYGWDTLAKEALLSETLRDRDC